MELDGYCSLWIGGHKKADSTYGSKLNNAIKITGNTATIQGNKYEGGYYVDYLNKDHNNGRKSYYENVVCWQGSQSNFTTSVNSGNEMKVLSRIKFNDYASTPQMRVYTFKKVNNNNNNDYNYKNKKYGAYLAYLSTYSGKRGSQVVGDRNTYLQYFTRGSNSWSKLQAFFNSIKVKGETIKVSRTSKITDSGAKTAIKQAEQYEELATTYKKPSFANKAYKTKNKNGGKLVGPFRFTYTKSVKSGTTMANILTPKLEGFTGTWYISDKDGNKKTDGVVSGKDFYIWLNTTNNVSAKIVIPYKRLVVTGDYIWVAGTKNDPQIWGATGNATREYKNDEYKKSFEIGSTTTPTGTSITIKKIDSVTKQPIPGISFRVESNIGNNNYTGVNETGLITGNDGKISFDVDHFGIPSNINVNGNIYVYEEDSDNDYYTKNEQLVATIDYKHHEELYYITYKLEIPQKYQGHIVGYQWVEFSEIGPFGSYDKIREFVDGMKRVHGARNSEYTVSRTTPCWIEVSTNGQEVVVENTKAYSLQIKKKDAASGADLKAKVRIQYEDDGTYLNTDGNYSSTPKDIEVNGTLNISGIKRGIYHIYETEAPSGYQLDLQDGYDDDIGMVDADVVEVDDDNKSPSITIYNDKYLGIRGKAWIDIAGKGGTRDYLGFEKAYVTDVQLLKDGVVVAQTQTNGNGEYEFQPVYEGETSEYTELDSQDKIRYSELEHYTVQFKYNQEKYVTVPIKNVTNGSKAIDKEVENLNDNNLVGKYAWATTKSLSTNDYNANTRYVENINFGIMEKPTTDHSVVEEIEYVTLKKGGYTFKYRYGEDSAFDSSQLTQKEYLDKVVNRVSLQNSSRTFTQKLYPCDIKYNAQEGISEDNKLKVYVTYKINVINNSPYYTGNSETDENLYVEDKLYLNSLTNKFDTKYYELSTVNTGDNTQNSEFGKWSGSGDTVTYNLNGSDFSNGISARSYKTTYIQFKVKEDALNTLVKPQAENMLSCKSEAYTNGYHKYYRKDSYWNANTQYKNLHTSVNENAEDTGLYFKIALSDTRKIQGTVFEDTKISNSRQDERIGDGKYNTSNEKNFTDVVVSLIDIDKNQVAKLYDGLLELKNNKWVVKTVDAITKVKEDGTYSLNGVVPGNYMLKFTYGNGETEYRDASGNIVNISSKIAGNSNAINPNMYKSTILTGPAKDAVTDTGIVDQNRKWYLDNMNDDKNGNKYSVAFDEYSIIADRMKEDNKNTELNYSFKNNNRGIVNAISPYMNIMLEFVDAQEASHADDVTKNDNNSGTLRTNCSGMNFGIIERPHTQIEIEKNIKNVKLTLQNGTTIINGNPADRTVSQYLTNMDSNNLSEFSKYAKIEIANEKLYGSELEINYQTDITNKSEKDYATANYYLKGITSNGQDVKTIASKIIDYIPSDWKYDETQLSNGKAESIDDVNLVALNNLDDLNSQGFLGANAYETNNSNKYKKILLTSGKYLQTWKFSNNQKTDNNTLTYYLDVKKLLNNNDENLGLTSYSEIISVKNITKTPQTTLTSGNYAIDGTSEADDSYATMVVTAPTGENRNPLIYLIVGITLIGVATIVISIKKVNKL